MQNRTYQVVVFGATGFTGRLVAEYLAGQYAEHHADQRFQLRWAMAGRSRAKLQQVAEELGATNVPLLVADSQDEMSLRTLCAQTDVVCTTVGPYAKYGEALTAACVAEQTDYCDLSGEVPFMRRTIERHHNTAVAQGVRLVHSCGFDSIPSDIGLLHHQREAVRRFGAACTQVDMVLAGARGGFSGGTFASLFNVLRERRESAGIAAILDDPYALNLPAPDGACPSLDRREAGQQPVLGVALAPFVMATINTRIVRRSHALAGFPYGQEFCYSEAMATGRGLLASLTAKLMATTMRAVERGGWVSRVAQRLVPDPGEGPGRAAREAGFFKVKFVGQTAKGQTLLSEVRGNRDPGYGATSRMLAESAVALARTRHEQRAGGVLTPALAIGNELLKQLPEQAGVTFRFLDAV